MNIVDRTQQVGVVVAELLKDPKHTKKKKNKQTNKQNKMKPQTNRAKRREER